jgi:hypothetical protein
MVNPQRQPAQVNAGMRQDGLQPSGPVLRIEPANDGDDKT